MSLIKIVISLLFIGLLIHLYVNYLPAGVKKFQDIILNEEIKKDSKNIKETQQNKEEDVKEEKGQIKNEDEIYNKKAEEELNKILNIKRDEKREERSFIDKVSDYIKMLKDKILRRGEK